MREHESEQVLAMSMLDESSILAEARNTTGLDDFGDASFREPLRRLLSSLVTEAGLSEAGLHAQRQRIVGLLASRLRTEDYFRRFPEIENEEIRAPIVIVGLPRTGTTMLHRAITSDRRFYAAYWWECRHPAPFPETRFGEYEPRIEAAEQEVKAVLAAVPKLAAIHPWDARGAEEDVILMESSFITTMPESSANVPSYRQWLETQDQGPAYAYLRRLLKFLQWQKKRAGGERQRWILKAPHHLHSIADLFRAFPDAGVINTHRDPLDTIPSIVSFYAALHDLNAPTVDKQALGRWMLDKWSASLARTMDYFDAHPQRSVTHVLFRDTVRDPVGTVKGAYAWMGMPMTAEVEQALQQHLKDNVREKREKHVYDAAEFGLSQQSIKLAFAKYRARFVAESPDPKPTAKR